MTQEQIDKECDAIVKTYYTEMNPDAPDCNLSIRQCIQCAILHQTGIVETWDSIEHEVGLGNYILKKKTESKQILETLKSRVK